MCFCSSKILQFSVIIESQKQNPLKCWIRICIEMLINTTEMGSQISKVACHIEEILVVRSLEFTVRVLLKKIQDRVEKN